MVPVIGFAACGLQSWYDQAEDLGEVPAGLDLLDGRSFAIKAIGYSMMPEGIRPGYLCYCTPGRPPGRRDAIYIRRSDGSRSIKLYLGRTNKGWYRLRGWLDPDADGRQVSFEEECNPDFVAEITPIVYVRRSL